MENSVSLNEKQQTAFNDFKDRIAKDESLNEDEKSFCDDRCLLRYLRARNFDLEKSKKMLYDTIEWRRKQKPASIPLEEVKGVYDLGGFYQHGVDKQGRPIVIVKPGNYNPFTPEQRMRYLVYLMEHAISSMDKSRDVEKICWILDFSNFANRQKSPQHKTEEKVPSHMQILQNHYPERLGSCFVINAPWWLSAAYKVAYLFIDSTTRAKISWIYGSPEELGNQLGNHISLSELESRYGGSSVRDFVAQPEPENTTTTPIVKEETETSAEEKRDVSDLD